MIFIILFVSVDINFKVDEYLSIEILTPFCDLGKIEPFDKEKEYISALKIRVYANIPWELRCEPEGDFVSQNGSIIPSDILSIRAKGCEYQRLEKTGITLCRGNKTKETGDMIPIDLKINSSFNFEPGEYKTRLIISIMRL